MQDIYGHIVCKDIREVCIFALKGTHCWFVLIKRYLRLSDEAVGVHKTKKVGNNVVDGTLEDKRQGNR